MNTRIVLACCLILFCAGPLRALAFQYNQGRNLEVGYTVADFSYQEPDMEEDGILQGVTAMYLTQNPEKYFTAFSGRFLYGEVDYDGETWGGTPAQTQGPNYIAEGRLLLGRRYVRGGISWNPILGFGARYWNDDQESTDTLATYERETIYYYSPFGAMLGLDLKGNWSTVISAQYNLVWAGNVTSNFSDIDPKNDDITVYYPFMGGYGLESSLRLTLKKGGRSWTLEPYGSYWDFDTSDKQGVLIDGSPAYLYEPANETLLLGISLKLGF
jgi:hypothetical protein